MLITIPGSAGWRSDDLNNGHLIGASIHKIDSFLVKPYVVLYFLTPKKKNDFPLRNIHEILRYDDL